VYRVQLNYTVKSTEKQKTAVHPAVNFVGKVHTNSTVFSSSISLKGQCHEMEIFFEGLNILIGTFCVCSDGFVLIKAFHYTIQLLTFYLLTWNYLLILKMLTETLLCDWLIFSSADLSLSAGEMCQELTSVSIFSVKKTLI
jgi:hypothetical protein